MFGALVPISYSAEPSQSTVNTTAISSNSSALTNLQDQINTEINLRVSNDITHTLTIATMQAEIDALTNLVNQQQNQINELIDFANTLQGNT